MHCYTIVLQNRQASFYWELLLCFFVLVLELSELNLVIFSPKIQIYFSFLLKCLECVLNDSNLTTLSFHQSWYMYCLQFFCYFSIIQWLKHTVSYKDGKPHVPLEVANKSIKSWSYTVYFNRCEMSLSHILLDFSGFGWLLGLGPFLRFLKF